MNNKALLALVAVMSGGIGFAAGWFIKEKLDDKFFEEIREQIDNATEEQIKEEVNRRMAESAINKYKGVQVNPSEEEKAAVIPPKMVLTEADMPNNKVIKPDTDKPKVISVEDWNDEMDQDPDWDKLEYTYFPTRDLLCDEEAMIRIMDYTYEIGSEALDILHNLDKEKKDDAVVFVRNPYLGCDIMITVDWEEPNAEWFDVPDLNDMEGGVKG